MNFWTRPLRQSAIYTLDSWSKAMPHGMLSCPGPDPLSPQAFSSRPSLVKTCTRLLTLSTIHRLSSLSKASPQGRFSSPPSETPVPHLPR